MYMLWGKLAGQKLCGWAFMRKICGLCMHSHGSDARICAYAYNSHSLPSNTDCKYSKKIYPRKSVSIGGTIFNMSLLGFFLRKPATKKKTANSYVPRYIRNSLFNVHLLRADVGRQVLWLISGADHHDT